MSSSHKKHIFTKAIPIEPSFSQSLGTRMVELVVGEGARQDTFTVHKDLLCSRSAVFTKYFSSSSTGVPTPTANLPKDSPDAFGMVVTWLYRNAIVLKRSVKDSIILRRLIKFFAFAEIYAIDGLCDMTMYAITKHCREGNVNPGNSSIELGYSLTHKNSKLRAFLSGCLAYTLTSKADGDNYTTEKMVPVGPRADEITFDCFHHLRAKKDGKSVTPCRPKDPRAAAACDYHQHGEREPCLYVEK